MVEFSTDPPAPPPPPPAPPFPPNTETVEPSETNPGFDNTKPDIVPPAPPAAPLAVAPPLPEKTSIPPTIAPELVNFTFVMLPPIAPDPVEELPPLPAFNVTMEMIAEE